MRSTVTTAHAALLDDARDAGLLGERTEQLSFEAPAALVEAAMRATGISSVQELGVVALSALACPDPVAEVLKRLRGNLGDKHSLDF
ncbi:hypothetical protein SAMN02799631_05522 [Methylobacterium sp. 174MFSha1.1]|uniref:hypothetical protein n=1 Tax=Methylobacterium sp. 174MFSha1.1 TaxID=1502749 RepID=UPI0008EABD8B|nr:hypothetical protein [Methylobacterium sp. 174MFSha1.1]SFV12653.1 hypothetical protein SAMN02799631_05522 [Methylobacterium sp. 174MFSha1.1]